MVSGRKLSAALDFFGSFFYQEKNELFGSLEKNGK
jgi:hypothetical protein